MSKIVDFYEEFPGYVDLRKTNTTDVFGIKPMCKTCKQAITIVEEEEEINGRSVDYKLEMGHLDSCLDKNKEKVIGGEYGKE